MKKRLKYLVIHCTATSEGRFVTADDIRRWHTSPVSQGGRGWHQVGYSNLFLLDGNNVTIVDDNGDGWVDENEITNGVKGINDISKHICYVGGMDKTNSFSKDTRTPQQKENMEIFVTEFIKKHPDILVAGHNDFAAKDCPSFNVAAWCKEIGIDQKNIYIKT